MRSIANAVLVAMAASSASAAVYDFETAGQYASNFRMYPGSGALHTVTQTSLGAANDYVRVDAVGTGSKGAILLWDTTPANTSDAWNSFDGTISVEWSVMANNANSSFAVLFINPTTSGTDKNIMAILNITADANNNEFLRFFHSAPLDGSGAGTVIGSTQTANVAAQGTFATMSVSYTPATGVLAASVGSLSYSQTLSSTIRNAVGTFPGIALRVNDTNTNTGGTAPYFDNVTVVPEPASVALLSLAALPLLRRRRA